MKVAIVAPSPVPFTLGGAERFYNGLVRAINELTPHDVELVKLPTREHSLPDLVASYRAFTRLDLSHFDLVVSSKYPAWMVAHPNHTVYMLHTLRGLYDTYWMTGLPERARLDEPELAGLLRLVRSHADRAALDELFAWLADLFATRGPEDPAFAFPGPLAREVVRFLDAVGLEPRSVRRHLAISATVAHRPGYFPAAATVEVVYPPSDLEGHACRRFDHLFTASRLDAAKRIDLLVRAMRSVPGAARLYIAGTGPELERLRELAQGDPRIEFLGYVATADLLDLYADALAVPFVPFDEDLGLVTLEAMASGKPVVTCDDSGGPTELIVDGVNGQVVPPTSEALGWALTRLVEDPALARRLGAAGRQRAAGITWRRAVAQLLRSRPAAPARPGRRPRLAVASTFVVCPPSGGGQLRCFHLYGALTSGFDVEVVSLGPFGERASRTEIRPGMVETVIPKSLSHQRREVSLSDRAGVPLTDVLAGQLITETPEYLEALAGALRGAAAVLLAHPFLYPAVRLVDRTVPILYDAHNAEFLLKSAVLPRSELGAELFSIVRGVEEAATREAVLVSVCSTEDAAALRAEYGADPGRLLIVENGVDVAGVPFVDPELRPRLSEAWRTHFLSDGGAPTAPHHLALFLGSWHPPNLEAARHIFDLAPALPQVLFLMVGGHCEYFRGVPLPPNVILVGMVSDLIKRALLRSADVALNPMLSGAGTNLKIVEYFAAGVPVVSTALGARGLDVEPRVHLEVASVEGFREAALNLLIHPEQAGDMARRARRLVEERYDWSVLGARLLEAVVNASQGSAPLLKLL